MKYIVYITVNLCNGKFYIGVHRTNPEVFDGYIGDGIYRLSEANKDYAFHRAVRKYGYENFKRTAIVEFPDTEEGKKKAFELETILVNETLLKSKNVYNTSLGGLGEVKLDELKTVFMFDLKGEYLRSFKSAKDAAIFLNIENVYSATKAIRNNCLGTTLSAFQYFWSYKKEFTYKNNKKWTPVAQYTLEGKFLRYFDSMTEAEAALQVNSIEQAIKKKYQCGGYQWRYYTGDNSDVAKLINNLTKMLVLPITMLDKEGNVIKEYSCINECVKEHPEFSKSQINRVLKGIIKSHKGFVFKDKDIV